MAGCKWNWHTFMVLKWVLLHSWYTFTSGLFKACACLILLNNSGVGQTSHKTGIVHKETRIWHVCEFWFKVFQGSPERLVGGCTTLCMKFKAKICSAHLALIWKRPLMISKQNFWLHSVVKYLFGESFRIVTLRIITVTMSVW